MSGFIEQIRVGASGALEVLKRSVWSGAALSRDQFREIAFAILNDEGRGAPPKIGTSLPPEGSSACEAVRFVRDDGSELYRYDLKDLENDNSEAPGRSKT